MRLVITLFLSVTSLLGSAQVAKTLTYDEYMAIVLANHPIAQQAALKLDVANFYQQKAKGSLDPKAYGNANQKYFDGTNYYSLIDAGLKIPTWIGAEVKAGYENNDGKYLSGQNRTPDDGLWYAGVEIPLGKGLFIDERRVALKQAKIGITNSELESKMQLSELVFNAGTAYWNWFESYQQYLTFDEATKLAQLRLDGVKLNANIGESAKIDTLEAGLLLQNRLVTKQEVYNNYLNAKEFLNVFLWADGVVPMELDSLTLPIEPSEVTFAIVDENVVDSILLDHTYIQLIQNKLEILEIEQKWKKEQLKPQLNLNYNALATNSGSNTFSEYSYTNYKWGLNFEIPLFLRKERADLNLNRVKMLDSKLELEYQKLNINAKVNVAKNNYNNAMQQAVNYRQISIDYSTLLNAENSKFDAGESNLFMVNSREVKFLEAQLKYLESLKKAKIQLLKLDYVLFNI